MQNFIKVQNCANYLKQQIKRKTDMPIAGLVLGTGLGAIADNITDPVYIPFSSLPDFPLSGVISHAGRFVIGTARGVPIIVQQGRCHLYEGYSAADVCMGTRVMAMLGVKTLVLTNAAGALNPLFTPGTVMAITDHINFTGVSPLTGSNYEDFGPRFPDMSRIYSPELIDLAEKAARFVGQRLEKGVYLGLCGPQLETPAETRAFRAWGADAVGMSTVLEAIAAKHMGMQILGLSCLTNKNLPDCMAETSFAEIVRVANSASETLIKILIAMSGDL